VAAAKQQAVIDAPVELIWELVGDPNRHGEWWPGVIEMECEELAAGCQFRGVVKGPFRAEEHEFTFERLDDCREVLIRCEGTGVYTRFVLAPAQDATFVEAEFGADPQSAGMRILAVSGLGRLYLRRWLAQSLEALREAATETASSAKAT
jgi:hypothetical protein